MTDEDKAARLVAIAERIRGICGRATNADSARIRGITRLDGLSWSVKRF